MSTFVLASDFVTETCCHKGCGVTFAFVRSFYEQVRNDSTHWWYCPNGHKQHYTGKSDAQKLRDAEARELALRDQLGASIRDAEAARVALMRDRQRFANGVCPCCNRYFSEVRRHMQTVHPTYDIAAVAKPLRFKCGCGRSFESFKGLRTHQGHNRGAGWDKPGAPSWRAHLTEAAR